MSPAGHFGVAILVLGFCARAADWPQWRGPTQDGHVPAGVALAETLAAAPKVVWQRPVGNGFGSPVVSGARVFFLDNQNGEETVHAARANTGQDLWTAPLDATFTDTQSVPGPRSTPVVDGDRVYVQSCRGEFRCLDTATGTVHWRVNFARDFAAVFIGEKGAAVGASRHGNTASPVVDGDHVLVSVGGSNGASVVCFDKRSGAVIWKSQSDVPGHSGPVLASLAGVRQAVSFTAAGVMALDPRDGALLWRVPVKSSIGRHVVTPVVVGDGVFVSSHEAGLIGLRVSKDDAGWQVRTAWTARESAINFASPVVVGGHLYGVGPACNLICVDIQTGRQAWSQAGYFRGEPGSAYAGFLVMDRQVLFLTNAGELVLIAADATKCRELGRTQICGANWCNPAYADGRLYFRDARQLGCVQLVP